MSKKYTLNQVKEIFTNQGCILLSDEYKNTQTPMEYICSCGNKSKIQLNNFLLGNRCRNCGGKKTANKLKLSLKEVRDIFEAENCILLSKEYINDRTNLDYICSCGNKSKILLINFKKGQRCENCREKRRKNKINDKYPMVFEYFKMNDCVLLSKEYFGSTIPLDYICSCGNKAKITFTDFKRGHRCKHCSNDRASKKNSHDYNFVYDTFKKNGCELLTKEYKNNKQKLDYICECGTESQTTFRLFLLGRRCKECSIKKQTGENNWNWKGGVSNLYSVLRERILTWKKDSMEFCNYKCIITGESVEVIHHLYSFYKIVDETLRELNLKVHKNIGDYTSEELKNIENKCLELHYKYGLGVCLTKKVHDLFHSLYSRHNNSPEQFEEFKNIYFTSPQFDGDFLFDKKVVNYNC